MPLSHAVPDASSSSRCPPDVCVAAVLGDELHRVSVLGGREGMPRSLGSVYGGSVTRFLGGSLRGVAKPIDVKCYVPAHSAGVAMTVDGCSLLVADSSDFIHEYDVDTGSLVRTICGRGDGPLQFRGAHQMCVAPDGFVFVADFGNFRVQVLAPDLTFHGFIGESENDRPVGVCANADVVVVAVVAGLHVPLSTQRHAVVVIRRRDSAVLVRFGAVGRGRGEIACPTSVCFMDGGRRVAVADGQRGVVSVFTIDGEFIRHVGEGVLDYPQGLACSAFDELVVATPGRGRICVFSDVGDLLMTFGMVFFTGVCVHGASVLSVAYGGHCIMWS